jgi:hypothetical protein
MYNTIPTLYCIMKIKTNDHVFIGYIYDLIISTNFGKDYGVFLDQNPLCSLTIIGRVYIDLPLQT